LNLSGGCKCLQCQRVCVVVQWASRCCPAPSGFVIFGECGCESWLVISIRAAHVRYLLNHWMQNSDHGPPVLPSFRILLSDSLKKCFTASLPRRPLLLFFLTGLRHWECCPWLCPGVVERCSGTEGFRLGKPCFAEAPASHRWNQGCALSGKKRTSTGMCRFPSP
jgi:hypothetical protein